MNVKTSSIFKNIILELARAWSKGEIRGAVKNYLVVFKPEVRPRNASAAAQRLYPVLRRPTVS